MTADSSKQLLSFVLTSSRNSLGDLYLARLNEVANLEKQLRELIPKLVNAQADALLVEFLRDHGEELVAGQVLDISPPSAESVSRRHALEPRNASDATHTKAARHCGVKSA